MSTPLLFLKIKELEIVCLDNNQAKGRKKTELKNRHLEEDLRCLVDGKAQVDPQFQTVFYYARTSARAVRHALIEEKDYQTEQLPSRQTNKVRC